MKKSILLMAVLIALVSLCLVFASCDSGSSDSGGDGPTPPPAPTPVTYTISFDANGGSGTMNSEIVEAGTSYEIPENGFTAPKIPVGAVNEDADIQFVGWNTAADGTGTTYEVKGTIPKEDITANITLYAQWANPSFTVNATGKQVYFAKGNLQATINASGDPTAWKFAANQYDYLGEGGANKTIGSASGDIDLFGWSTNAASNNWGIHTKTEATENFTTGNFNDWGKAIGDGKTWHTLSNAEWDYLRKTRTVNGGTGEGKSYQRATINSGGTGVYGMIIYPDNYTAQTAATSYTSVEWTAMEAAGCVFLPAAGYRIGSSVYSVGTNGYYWSSTRYNDTQAYCLYFHSDSAGTNSVYRYSCRSVRLVCGVSEN